MLLGVVSCVVSCSKTSEHDMSKTFCQKHCRTSSMSSALSSKLLLHDSSPSEANLTDTPGRQLVVVLIQDANVDVHCRQTTGGGSCREKLSRHHYTDGIGFLSSAGSVFNTCCFPHNPVSTAETVLLHLHDFVKRHSGHRSSKIKVSRGRLTMSANV